MTTWRVGIRVRRIGTRDVVTLTYDQGGGVWIGRGPNGEMVALVQTEEWELVA